MIVGEKGGVKLKFSKNNLIILDQKLKSVTIDYTDLIGFKK